MSEFEPKILTFCCNWCSYAGADMAGVSRMQYPPTTRILRVMCSSRIEPNFIIEALRDGFDGVLVTGCHIGDCHYIEGNKQTQRRIEKLMPVLETLGLAERVRLEWVSASESPRFRELMEEFTSHIKTLGPNPLKEEAR
jgi:F420-non-reducing hydrogenase iron-sulfur subunit